MEGKRYGGIQGIDGGLERKGGVGDTEREAEDILLLTGPLRKREREREVWR